MSPTELLKRLIAIPSINPMGRELSGPEYFEAGVADFLERTLLEAGLPCERVDVVPGRSNLLTRIDNPAAGRTVLFDAHMDTVPVDGMTIAPFDPVERDGRIYGRGSCDVKGGLAAMLAAVLRLHKSRPAGMPNVVLSMTCDEESTSLGVHHLTAGWISGTPTYRLCPTPPDVAIIAEPTLLDIVTAHRGAVRWKIRTTGRACHSSRPQEGINAIYRMARVLEVLEDYAAWLPESRPAHPLCGPATFSVGLISGGSSVNVVPDGCSIDVDRRLLPGEDAAEAREEIITWLRQRLDFELVHDAPYCASCGLNDSRNGALASELLQVINRVEGGHRCIGVPFGTHASRIELAGVPSVVFGPGDIAQAHTKDEWIAVEQLHKATEIYELFGGGMGGSGVL
ncbi:MAG: Acetylornithine deacetylase [Planctomycetota bacterium]|jgi:acetylornithine deacetylase